MNSKRWFIATAVLTLLVAIAVTYRLSPKKEALASVVPLPSHVPAATPSPQVQTDKVEPGSDVASKIKRWSSPVPLRDGRSKPSTDLVVALHHHPEIMLSKEETEKLLTAYIQMNDKRSNFEASIADVVHVSSTENRIIIPTYKEEGEKMQADLYKKVVDIVGPNRALSIQQALSPELYARNFGFGAAEQEIDVKLLDTEAPVTYSFSHSVGTLHLRFSNNGGGVVTYKNMESTRTIGDLGDYSGMLSLLPKGGS